MARGVCSRVIVCESRPLMEGVTMARALAASAGASHTTATDTSAAARTATAEAREATATQPPAHHNVAHVQVITDAQAALFMQDVDAVLLGSDCVHELGIDNKVLDEWLHAQSNTKQSLKTQTIPKRILHHMNNTHHQCRLVATCSHWQPLRMVCRCMLLQMPPRCPRGPWCRWCTRSLHSRCIQLPLRKWTQAK